MRVAPFHRFAVAALLALGLACTSSPSRAASGAVHIELYKASLIVGLASGTGTLRMHRRSYPISIGGVSWGASVGASKAMLAGRVSNVRNAADVAGTYTATGTGSSWVTGHKVVRLTNERGVILELQGSQAGFEFSADLSGLVIALR